MSDNQTPEKVWTVIELIKWGTDFFNKKEIDSPRLTIELLICDILKLSRIQIYTNFDKPLSKDELAKLRDYVIRRAKKEPLQYIIGYEEFFGLKFFLNNETLIPRPETELLVEKALKMLKNDSQCLKIADFCSGSGCIGISVAKNIVNSDVYLFDISNKALELSKQNAIENNVSNVNFRNLDLLKDHFEDAEFDVILSNPPYISVEDSKELQDEVRLYEPRIAYCDENDGLTFYKKFKNIFNEKLKKSGIALLEFGFGEDEYIREIFKDEFDEIEIINDYSNIPRIAILKGKK